MNNETFYCLINFQENQMKIQNHDFSKYIENDIIFIKWYKSFPFIEFEYPTYTGSQAAFKKLCKIKYFNCNNSNYIIYNETYISRRLHKSETTIFFSL